MKYQKYSQFKIYSKYINLEESQDQIEKCNRVCNLNLMEQNFGKIVVEVYVKKPQILKQRDAMNKFKVGLN